MSQQLQLRRGTGTQITGFTGAQGEVVVDTSNNRMVVNDGLTVGGFPAAKLSEVITNARFSVGDVDYTVSTLDRLVAYTSITAARNVTLPQASTYPGGTTLTVVDESGSCSATNTITLTAHSGDLINGAATTVISSPHGYVGIEASGTGWTIVDSPIGGLAGIQPVANGGTGVAPSAVPYLLKATGINANSVADTLISVPLPSGFTKYRVNAVTAFNPLIPLGTAHAAVYTAAGAGGATVCSPQSLSSLSTSSANTNGNAVDLNLAAAVATFFTAGSLYFRITTAQGTAATVDAAIEIKPYE
jgi:hypothetical protein